MAKKPSLTIRRPKPARHLPPTPAGDPLPPPLPRELINLELGRTGLTQYYGRIVEEFLPELQYERGRRVFREMSDNDPTIGALLTAVELLMRGVPWRIESDVRDDPRAAFLDECKDDMDHPFADIVAEATRGTMVFGWSLHELVYKPRVKGKSKFPDHKVGWKRMPVRSQESLWRWDFDPDTQDLRGMFQRPPPDFVERYIPIEKAVLFRFVSFRGNPEGRSALRNAYRPWYFKKHIEQIEAIGIERDLAGYPIIWVPAELMDPNPPAGSAQILTTFKNIAVNLRRDELEGLVMPLKYDPETKQPLYKVELLQGAGARQMDTTAIVNRYDVRILLTVLCDFMLLGQTQRSGSYAMAKVKTDLFHEALGAWTQSIADVLNDAGRKLLELNGMDTEDAPKFIPGDIERKDLQALGAYLQSLAAAGMPLFPNPKLENVLLENADLPTMTPEEMDIREQEDAADKELDEVKREAAVAQAEAAKENPPAAQPQPKPVVGPGTGQPAGSAPKPPSGAEQQEHPSIAKLYTLIDQARREIMKSPEVHVHIPESLKIQAPQVTVHPAITVQAAKAPDVQVVVPSPLVKVGAPEVNVHVDTSELGEAMREQTSVMRGMWSRLVEAVTRKPKVLTVAYRGDGKITSVTPEDEPPSQE